jgi:hypothetical protein
MVHLPRSAAAMAVLLLSVAQEVKITSRAARCQNARKKAFAVGRIVAGPGWRHFVVAPFSST